MNNTNLNQEWIMLISIRSELKGSKAISISNEYFWTCHSKFQTLGFELQSKFLTFGRPDDVDAEEHKPDVEERAGAHEHKQPRLELPVENVRQTGSPDAHEAHGDAVENADPSDFVLARKQFDI